MLASKAKPVPEELPEVSAKTRRGRKPKVLAVRNQESKDELELQCPEKPIEIGLVIKEEASSRPEAMQV